MKHVLDYYDMDGNSIGQEETMELFKGKDARRVAQDCIETSDQGTVWISTVLLVLDHGINSDRPIIFETMAFLSTTAIDAYTNRYCTKEEALVGHRLITMRVKEDFNNGKA